MVYKEHFNGATFFLKENKTTVLTVIFLIVITDIIFVPESLDFIFFGLFVIYGIAIWIYKLKSRLTFLFCLLLLSIMYIEFIFTGTSQKTEKAGIWLFLFMTTGMVQQIRQ